MSQLPSCPKCQSDYTYADGDLLICPSCAHEWSATDTAEVSDGERVIKDANGNVLADHSCAQDGQMSRSPSA